MKTKIYAALAGAGILMLGACSSEAPQPGHTFAEGTVTFSAEMNRPTRATETAFEQGDQIGILYNKEDQNNQWNFLSPCPYVYNADRFEPADENNSVVKTPGDKYGYIAFYPYSADLFMVQKFAMNSDQTTHEAYTASDFCAAWSGLTDQTSVDLTFYHCLSHVVVNVNGMNLAGDMSATLNNVATETTIDIASRTFAPTGVTSDVKMLYNGTLSYKAIVSPQTIQAGERFLTININGRDFPLQMETALEFKSGREYVFNVQVINGEVVGFDAQLRPWNATESSELFSEKYFQIQDAVFIDNDIQPGEAEPEDFNIGLNQQALAGGLNFIIIRTGEDFRSFQVSSEGERGYWECSPEKEEGAYKIPVVYGLGLESDVNMSVVGVYPSGEKTKAYDCSVSYVESKIGDLNINLTFSTPKDVDLHLITPSGTEIYYGNRGGLITIDGVDYEYGLDHDSNAACNLDYLNNENIFLPAAMIEEGEYVVKVNMYSNCNSSYDCEWAISTRYNGEFVRNKVESMGNPAVGNYARSCGNGDHTVVMRFTLIEPGTSRRPAMDLHKFNIRPRALTESEEAKIKLMNGTLLDD